jgi:acyl carrier protein
MMVNDEISAYVKEFVAEMLCIKVEEIDEAQLLSDYGLNSVDFIDIVVKLETRYQLAFDPATMKSLSCQSLVQNIETALAAH